MRLLVLFNVAFNNFSVITTVSGCDRELSAYLYSAAALKYHARDTWHDTTPSHITLTLGRPVLALPRMTECQASTIFNDFVQDRTRDIPFPGATVVSIKWRAPGPAKTQISLDIRPVWTVFAVRMKKRRALSYPLRAQRRLMPRLVLVFAGRTGHFAGLFRAAAHYLLLLVFIMFVNVDISCKA